MPKEAILIFVVIFVFIVIAIIIRSIVGAIRSTFSRVSIIGLIVGVITALLARSRSTEEQRKREESSPTADDRGEAAWIVCSYCGSKNRSSETKCRNCGALL
jgi:hypothetical protein